MKYSIESKKSLKSTKLLPSSKKGGKIKIKPENKGKFTEYCGGKVTQECITKGKNSPNPTIVKRATFADNARKWKHSEGGKLLPRKEIFDISNILSGWKK